MSDESTPQKPEWFQMAESDQPTSNQVAPSTKSRSLPLIALLATGAILAGGAVFANIRQEQPAVAEDNNPQNFAGNPNVGGPAQDSITAPSANSDGSIQAPPPNGRIGDGDGDHQFGDRPDGDGNHRFPPRDGRHHDGEHEGEDDDFGQNPSTGTDA